MRLFLLCFCALSSLILSTRADDDDDDDDYFNYYNGVEGSSSLDVCDNKALKGGWSFTRIKGSCNQYLQCTEDDRAFLQTCAAGTFYDGKQCRHASDVLCPADPCLRKPHGFVYTDGQSCYGFYKCYGGRSQYLTCEDGFYFNPYKNGCFRDPTCRKNNLMHPCAFGTTLPFPGRPNLFYLYNGYETMTPMKCPKGTWYRPDICTCDWIIPGKIEHGGCKPMFHFKYSGNFLEKYNRVQQSPTTGVALFRKSALFDQGGKIIIWAMNNLDLNTDFSLCFEFMVQTMGGEIALLSNDYGHARFTYKITYIPSSGIVNAFIVLKDGTVVKLMAVGVDPMQPHFIRIAKLDDRLQLRIDNAPVATAELHTGIASSKSPLVIGAASGCSNFVGYFDELKFFRCVPRHFFGDYDESGERDDDDDFNDDFNDFDDKKK